MVIKEVPTLNSSSSSKSVPETSTTIAQDKLTSSSFFTKDDTLNAEVLWCLKLIDSHWSYNCSHETSKYSSHIRCPNKLGILHYIFCIVHAVNIATLYSLGDLFCRMFPDSAIAKSFQCGEKKAAYLSNFGIAPHFLSLLTDRVKSLKDGYVLLFDESLNNKNQKKQLDAHVRFWDADSVSTRYFGTEFMGHATADDLMRDLDHITEELPRRAVLQMSMDGPSVNWKLYRKFEENISLETGVHLIDIGSCGLHIVHGAYKKGVESTGWDLSNVLSSFYRNFKDSPARREDFQKVLDVHEVPLMPLNFCKTRWVENVSVLERALNVLPNMKTYVKAVDGKKIPKPDTKTYETIKSACKDPLLEAKLQFALSAANEVSPFLRLYQTNKPMVPFLAADLYNLLKNILSRFCKSDVIQNATTALKLANFDIEDEELHETDYKKIDVGFSAEKLLRKLTAADVSSLQKMEFRVQCKTCLKSIAAKILEKAPIRYPIVRYVSCLDPREMAKSPDSCKKRLERLLLKLVELKRIEERDCDGIKREYNTFLIEVVAGEKSKFKEFSISKDCLDTFMYGYLNSKEKFSKLWALVKMMLLLSHGQASVERGFSVNRQIEVENLSEYSYVSQRTVCDHIRSVGGVKNVVVDKALLQSAAKARLRYEKHLKEQKKEKSLQVASQKRKLIEEELDSLKSKKKRFSADQASLEKSAKKYSLDAEKEGKLELISAANGMWAKVDQKKKKLVELDKQIENKTSELKSV